MFLMRTSVVMTSVLLAALSFGCSSKSAEPPSGPGTVTITETTTSTTTSIPTTTTTTTTSTIEPPPPPPDLTLFTPTGRFCRSNSSGNLIVQVLNQGASEAETFVTRLSYTTTTAGVVSPQTAINVTTPFLQPGVLLDVTFPGSATCVQATAVAPCTFTINVDAGGTVPETLEVNNVAAGTCP
jgi:hypothetical protein